MLKHASMPDCNLANAGSHPLYIIYYNTKPCICVVCDMIGACGSRVNLDGAVALSLGSLIFSYVYICKKTNKCIRSYV